MTSELGFWERQHLRVDLRRYLRLFRGAIFFTLLMLVVSATTSSLGASPKDVEDTVGLSVHALQTGKFWVIPVATLVQSEPILKWLLPVFAFTSIALLEYRDRDGESGLHFLHK